MSFNIGGIDPKKVEQALIEAGVIDKGSAARTGSDTRVNVGGDGSYTDIADRDRSSEENAVEYIEKYLNEDPESLNSNIVKLFKEKLGFTSKKETDQEKQWRADAQKFGVDPDAYVKMKKANQENMDVITGKKQPQEEQAPSEMPREHELRDVNDKTKVRDAKETLPTNETSWDQIEMPTNFNDMLNQLQGSNAQKDLSSLSFPELQSELTTAQGDLAAKQAKLDGVYNGQDQEITQLQTDIASKQEEYDKLAENVDSKLKEEIDAKQKTIDEKDAAIKDKDSQISENKNKISSTKSKLEDFKGQLSTLEAALAAAEAAGLFGGGAAAAGIKAAIEVVKKAIDLYEKHLDNQEQKDTSLNDQKKSIQDEKKTLKAELKEKEKELNAQNKDLEKVQKELDDKKTELETKQEGLKTQYESEVTAAQNYVSQIEAEIARRQNSDLLSTAQNGHEAGIKDHAQMIQANAQASIDALTNPNQANAQTGGQNSQNGKNGQTGHTVSSSDGQIFRMPQTHSAVPRPTVSTSEPTPPSRDNDIIPKTRT